LIEQMFDNKQQTQKDND